jgi:hypothetical protein
VHFELAVESLRDWAQEQGIEDERLTLKPEDFGLRTTYLSISDWQVFCRPGEQSATVWQRTARVS